MTRADLIELVKVKIDELTPFDGGLALITSSGNTNLNPIEAYIEQFLDESTKDTLLEAPPRVLPMTIFNTVVYDLTAGSAVITLPEDYLRVGVLKFSSWLRPVYKATYPGDDDYDKQFNRWTRGGKAKPRATWTSEGGVGYLTCYGVEAETGNEMKYVALCVAEDIPELLIEPMTWHCAFQVMQVYSKEKQAEAAYSRYMKAITLL